MGTALNNEIFDYYNNDEFNTMLKKDTQQAENEMKDKMLKLLEIEKIRLKYNLIIIIYYYCYLLI